MNLILFDPAEIASPLPRADPRARHVLDVLRRRIGDTCDVGLVNGPIGKATLTAITTDALSFAFAWKPLSSPADPITLVIGLPRPQTARDILRDATTLGVAAVHFVATERSDTNYASSSLWSSGEWRRHCLTGAAQAFSTGIPAVTIGQPLAAAIAALAPAGARLALDNYEAATSLSSAKVDPDAPVVLAFGPERGWGPADRAALRSAGFTLVHLGPRVLRSETAVVAALTLVRAKLSLL